MDKLDFNNEEELASAFAEALTAYAPRPGLKERQRQQLFGSKTRQSADEAQLPGDANRRRRWIVWAVAASLLLAAFFVANRPESRYVNVAYAEFAAAFKKAAEVEWVHYFEGNREEWISFEPFRFYSRSPQGIIAFDRAANREYYFDRAANTLTVRWLGFPGEMESRGSFADIIRQKVASLEDEGRVVRKGAESFNGKAATAYEIAGYRANEGGKYVKGKYFFDAKNGRVLGFEGSGTGWLSWLKFWVVVDYPAEGPQDVYALGVPRAAKIIDETPPSEVVELVRQVDEARARNAGPIYQISVEANDSFSREAPPAFAIWVEVTYLKEGRLRRDRYGERRASDYDQSVQDLAAFRKEVLDGGIGAIERWLKERKPRQILFADTRTGESAYYELDREGRLIRESLHSTLTAQLLGRAWGQKPATLDLELGKSSTLVKDHQGPWGKLVGIENRRGWLKTEGWYVNPNRDYICERHDGGTGENNMRVTEVTEYDRTPTGHWYAKAASKSSHGGRDAFVIRNYRDDERAMDPSLFDESRITASDLSAD